MEYQIISTFEVPSTHSGKQFDPDYATRGTNCSHRLSKMTQAGTLDADVCALPGIKFGNSCLYNIHGGFSCFKYLNELYVQILKAKDGK